MSAAPPPTAAERLLELLPQIFRIRDYEQAVRIASAQGFDPPDPLADTAEGPLTTLLAALGGQLDLLEAEIDWLYEDQFIETCADWVVPYIGALVGARIVEVGDAESARIQVANTIPDRRAKGTTRALASRTRAVMVSPAEAIEYAAHVARTWHPNFPGANPAVTVAINGAPGRALRLPSTLGQYITELRDMREGGRFAPANIGARVWTARASEHAEAVPLPVAGGQPGRFRFDPLGRDIALWNQPTAIEPHQSRLDVAQIPGPIALTAAVDRPAAFYERSVEIVIGTPQPAAAICFCDLGDQGGPGQWNAHGSAAGKALIRIDPARGRFILPGGGAGVDPNAIRVRYSFGAALDAGGALRGEVSAAGEVVVRAELGGRDRRPETPLDFGTSARIIQGTDPTQAGSILQTSLEALGTDPALLIEFGGSLPTPPSTTLPANGNFEVRGGNGVWPTLPMAQPWVIRGGTGSTLTLRGVRLAGSSLQVAAEGLRQLTLIDCTLVPGSTRLTIDEPGCRVVIVRSIIGPVRVAPAVEIDLIESLVDSAAADGVAISDTGGGAGGILWSVRSTVIGEARLLAFDEVGDTIFAARPDRTLAGPVLSAQRLQAGCVRYSAIPRGSIVPRRYRCYPAEGDSTSPEPVFASLDYADPLYGTLVAGNPDALLTGAADGGEPGIGNRASYHRRKRLLDRDLIEWVPFGMNASTELMSD